MSPTLTTFLFEAANFLLLAAILGWLFFKPVRQALDEHRAKLETLAREASEKLAAAEQTRTEVESEREEFHAELSTLRSQALEAAQQDAASVVTQAREQATRIKQAAEQHVTHLEASQSKSLAHAIAAAAGTLVGKLLEDLNGTDLNAGLILAACNQLHGLSLDATPVTIESAQELTPDERSQFASAIGSASPHITWRVVNDLGGGVRITTARGLVDCSIQGLAGYGERVLAAELAPVTESGANDAA